MNLATHLVEAARRWPGRTVLRVDGTAITFAELERASARVAHHLHGLGVRPGDRVGLQLPNTWQFAALYFGVLRVGAVVVPLNPMLRQREVDHQLADSGARLLVTWQQDQDEQGAGDPVAGGVPRLPLTPTSYDEVLGGEPALDAVVPREDDDTAVILYTSGTTGLPKGACLSHGGITQNATCFVEDLLHVTSEDVVLGGLPLFHAFGQVAGLHVVVRSGACLAMLSRFDAGAALRTIQEHGVTIMAGVPSMYVGLLAHPALAEHDTTSLRLGISGGAAMPAEVMAEFEARLGCRVLEGYGLTETTCAATFNRTDQRRTGSIGTPIRDFALRVVGEDGHDVEDGAVGEVWISGPGLMTGYWGQPEATREVLRDGWLRTGDVGRRDADGFYYVVDRIKDLIIRGGYNVYPREVEEVLYEHPAVEEAAVVGVPDARLGEEVVAVVTLRPGAHAEPDELRDFVRDRVAAYKYPRRVQVVGALPKTATGKILKRELRAGVPAQATSPSQPSAR